MAEKRWKFCPECGHNLEAEWKHCAECGLEIGAVIVIVSNPSPYPYIQPQPWVYPWTYINTADSGGNQHWWPNG